MPPNKLHIVADADIPLVNELFGAFANIELISGRDIRRKHLSKADILLVRSVTQVNSDLLSGTPVKFVGTATAGVDHIDQAIQNSSTIGFASAPGANANSVVEYVVSAVAALNVVGSDISFGRKFGVVGAGNVGSLLTQRLVAMAASVQIYDPFVKCAHGIQVDQLEALTKCDVICLHVPLTNSGQFPTKNMIGAEFLSNLANGATVISAGRGGVVNEATLASCAKTKNFRYVADVWQDEPRINPATVALATIATPHIAGYSLDSKLSATNMLYQAVCEYFGLSAPEVTSAGARLTDIKADSSLAGEQQFFALIRQVWNLQQLTDSLKATAVDQLAGAFDQIRSAAKSRREFSLFQVSGLDDDASVMAAAVGFNLA